MSLLLDRLQIRAIRLVLGLMGFTPINVLYDLSGELPLKCRNSFFLNKTLLKIHAFSNFPVLDTLRDFENKSTVEKSERFGGACFHLI